MKKIDSARKFAKQFLVTSLVILTSFSLAEAQHRGGGGGRSFGGGGGRSFSGGGGRSFGGGGFSGGARINSVPRGNFGGGGRIAAVTRSAPGRVYAGVTVRSRYGYNTYRGGNYGRPYYGGYYGRPFFSGYGAYYSGYFPHIGFRISVLPYGYYPFYFGGYPYYYNEGLFYRQYADGGDYQVVAPPVGAEVPRLPRGAQDITIDGNQYFEKDGVYYQPIVNQDGKKVYRVAGKDGVLNTDGNGQQQNDQQYNYNNNNQQQPQYNNNQQQYNNNQQQPQNNSNQQQYNSSMPKVGDVVNSIPTDSRPVIINNEKLFVSPDGVYYQEDNSGSSRIFKVVGVASDESADAVSNQ